MGLYLAESFKGANILTKLAFIFLLLAMGIGWVSYCTASWGRVFPTADSDYYFGYGVWRISDNKFEKDANKVNSASGSNAPLPSLDHTDGWLLEWYGAFQAFATAGFICLNVGFFLVVLFMFVAPCKSNGDLAFWNAINNIVGSVFWLVAVILFGAEFDKTYDIYNYDDPTLHYSFGFAIVTFVLQLAAGIVLLLTNRGGGVVRQSASK